MKIAQTENRDNMADIKAATLKGDEWMLAEDLPDMSCLSLAQLFLGSAVSNLEKSCGRNYRACIAVQRGYTTTYYYGKRDSFLMGERIVDMIFKDPEFGHMINREIYKRSDMLIENAKIVRKSSLAKMSNSQLWKMRKREDVLHRELYEYGWLSNAADLFHANFTNRLVECLEGKAGSRAKANEMLMALTVPDKRSLLDEEADDFLAIVAAINADKFHKGLFEKGTIGEIENSMKGGVKKMVIAHRRKYHHWKYLFLGQHGVYDIGHYIKEAKQIVQSGVDAGAMLKKKGIAAKDAALEKERLKRELGIERDYSEAFDIWSEFMITKVYRRNAQVINAYYHMPLLREISKRLGVSMNQMELMLLEEIEKGLNGGKVDIGMVQARAGLCAYYTRKGVHKIWTGDEAKKIAEKLEGRRIGKVSELKGQCGSAGRAKGTVKIINSIPDMDKMEKGDILVSVATTPDVVPAMQKAAAIVTEQGGVTCHAAIVSREMGIPCLIGTKIATRVFKDLDMVDVDATAGIVKKISKKVLDL